MIPSLQLSGTRKTSRAARIPAKATVQNTKRKVKDRRDEFFAHLIVAAFLEASDQSGILIKVDEDRELSSRAQYHAGNPHVVGSQAARCPDGPRRCGAESESTPQHHLSPVAKDTGEPHSIDKRHKRLIYATLGALRRATIDRGHAEGAGLRGQMPACGSSHGANQKRPLTL